MQIQAINSFKGNKTSFEKRAKRHQQANPQEVSLKDVSVNVPLSVLAGLALAASTGILSASSCQKIDPDIPVEQTDEFSTSPAMIQMGDMISALGVVSYSQTGSNTIKKVTFHDSRDNVDVAMALNEKESSKNKIVYDVTDLNEANRYNYYRYVYETTNSGIKKSIFHPPNPSVKPKDGDVWKDMGSSLFVKSGNVIKEYDDSTADLMWSYYADTANSIAVEGSAGTKAKISNIEVARK